jgi:hypothetical protein
MVGRITKSHGKGEFIVLEYCLDELSLQKGFPKTSPPNMALDEKKEDSSIMSYI